MISKESNAKKIRDAIVAIGIYSFIVVSSSLITSSDFATSKLISWDFFFISSNRDITLSFSKRFPSEFNACNKFSSSSLSCNLKSLCALMRSSFALSTSGRSDFKMIDKIWFWSEEGVIVKLRNVTREQRSGVKWQDESLVTINILNVILKSISWSPMRIRFLPPWRWISLLRRLFIIGSIFSTSWTNIGYPNLNALSNVFKKFESVNEVLFSFLLA